jgi:RNA polymerase sigma-70 factor, ECF subfamily
VECSQPLTTPRPRAGADAFAELFAANRGGICRYLCSLVGDAAQAEDLAQDAFLKAYRALGRGDPPQNPRAWLYTIATNTAISHLRRRKLIAWLPLLPDAEAEHARIGPDPASAVGERDLIRRTFARLSTSDRSCLLLRFQADLTYAELAPVLGIGAGAAKTRVCRARAAFCEAYQQLSREVKR